MTAYQEKVLAFEDILYLPLDDDGEGVARNIARGGQSRDSLFVGADGNNRQTSPTGLSVPFIPENGYIDIHSNSLNAVFDGQNFTLGFWFKGGADLFQWNRWIIGIRSDMGQRHYIQVNSGPNAGIVAISYRANLISLGNTWLVGDADAWHFYGMSVSLSAGVADLYFNQSRHSETLKKQWEGKLKDGACTLGARSVGSTQNGYGWFSDFFILDEYLDSAEMEQLSIV